MITTLWLVFISAFGAATILPFYSELAVVAAFNKGYNPWLIWASASAGNTLGAVVNWLLGLYVEHFKGKRWFPFKEEQLEQGQRWFQRYGVWSLLFAWLPVGGDALTFIAGVMRVRFWLFLLLVAIGKSIRYAIFILALMQFF